MSLAIQILLFKEYSMLFGEEASDQKISWPLSYKRTTLVQGKASEIPAAFLYDLDTNGDFKEQHLAGELQQHRGKGLGFISKVPSSPKSIWIYKSE